MKIIHTTYNHMETTFLLFAMCRLVTDCFLSPIPSPAALKVRVKKKKYVVSLLYIIIFSSSTHFDHPLHISNLYYTLLSHSRICFLFNMSFRTTTTIMSALNFLFQNIILAYLSQGKQADGPTIARDLTV